jgi:site-specific recombinase XerD
MITISVERLLVDALPDEQFQGTHCLYVVRDGLSVIYVGKAERQSTHERLLQHLADEVASDFHGRAGGPSELGKYIRANAPQSNHWQIDLLSLSDCQQSPQSSGRPVSVAQAEMLLIQQHSPLLNRIYNSDDITSPRQSANSPRTLPHFAIDYLSSTSSNTKTQDTYRYALLRFQRFAEEEQLTLPALPLQPAQLYKEVLAHFLAWLQNAGLKNNSIRTFIAVVKKYLQWLQAENKLTPGLQAADMQLALESSAGPHLQSIPPKHRQADQSVARLLDYYSKLLQTPSANTPRGRRQRLAGLRNHAILQTLYSTAGKAGEVSSISYAQIVSALANDNSAQQLLPVEINSQGDKKRLIYLAPAAQEAIRAYIKARRELSAFESDPADPNSRSGALFVRHDRDYSDAISTKTIWLIVHDAAKAVFGTDSKGRPLKLVGPQHFRHLRAQNLYDAGMPADTLQAILGHSSSITTRKIYAGRQSQAEITREFEQNSRGPTEIADSQ